MRGEGKVIKLEYPIKVNGQEKTELVFRRPVGRDICGMEEVEGGDTQKTFYMISALSGLPQEDVSNLDIDDLASIKDLLEDFFKKFQGIGGID